MKLADSHCHVNDSKFDEDREEVFKRAGEELEFIVNIGNDLLHLVISYEYLFCFP